MLKYSNDLSHNGDINEDTNIVGLTSAISILVGAIIKKKYDEYKSNKKSEVEHKKSRLANKARHLQSIYPDDVSLNAAITNVISALNKVDNVSVRRHSIRSAYDYMISNGESFKKICNFATRLYNMEYKPVIGNNISSYSDTDIKKLEDNVYKLQSEFKNINKIQKIAYHPDSKYMNANPNELIKLIQKLKSYVVKFSAEFNERYFYNDLENITDYINDGEFDDNPHNLEIAKRYEKCVDILDTIEDDLESSIYNFMCGVIVPLTDCKITRNNKIEESALKNVTNEDASEAEEITDVDPIGDDVLNDEYEIDMRTGGLDLPIVNTAVTESWLNINKPEIIKTSIDSSKSLCLDPIKFIPENVNIKLKESGDNMLGYNTDTETINDDLDSIIESAEKYEMGMKLIQEAAGEIEFEKLLIECSKELYLDEGYVKNKLQAIKITTGPKIREADKCVKLAKQYTKAKNWDAAIKEQEKAISIMKEVYDECDKIEDDTKMVIVAGSILKSFVMIIAGMLVLQFGIKMVNSMFDQTLGQGKGAEILKSKSVRKAINLNKASVIVSGIINGITMYKTDMKKYTNKDFNPNYNPKDIKLPVNRIDAQMKLRRAIKLNENILRDYKKQAAIMKSGHKNN